VDPCSPGRHLTPFGFDALRDGLDPRFMGSPESMRFLGGTRRGRRGVIPTLGSARDKRVVLMIQRVPGLHDVSGEQHL
jgi:hypothetical protein